MRISILFLFFLCKISVFANDNVAVTGTIANASDKELYIMGDSFEKIIHVNADGSFCDSFEVKYNGAYSFYTKNNFTYIYLEKGATLTIKADDKDFETSIAFQGDNAVENTYWQQKMYMFPKGEEARIALFSLDESEYLKKIRELKNSVVRLYETTSFSNARFKEYENRNIHYLEELYYMIYQKHHIHYAKKEGFKTSDSFPKPDPSIDVDNETDYFFSVEYKYLIYHILYKNVFGSAGKKTDYTFKLSLPEIKKIKSNAIRAFFISYLTEELSYENPDAEILYNELMQLTSDPEKKEELTLKMNAIKSLKSGNVSSTFNYMNFEGGTISLESLKGKYIYIDIWATWCEPCLQEVPSLKKIQEQYKTSNITFVGISVDDKGSIEQWRKIITNKNLSGIQLLTDKGWDSKFIMDYAVKSIPRFILIDPNGNIVSADAPRPSDPKLIEKFNELGIK